MAVKSAEKTEDPSLLKQLEALSEENEKATAVCRDFDERQRVDVRCDNACTLGIPFPEELRSRLAALKTVKRENAVVDGKAAILVSNKLSILLQKGSASSNKMHLP